MATNNIGERPIVIKGGFIKSVNQWFNKIGAELYSIYYKQQGLIIGHNNGWKQKVILGKRNNQNLVYIPFNKLIKMIEYKNMEYGIDVSVDNESYTSKCSFLDNESVEYHDLYMGKRLTDRINEF